jgi:hypothetical protein
LFSLSICPERPDETYLGPKQVGQQYIRICRNRNRQELSLMGGKLRFPDKAPRALNTQITMQTDRERLHNSFETAKLAPLCPEQVDLGARRSISDSVLSRSRSNWNSSNTVCAFVNRSGASTVKKMIATINERCEQQCGGNMNVQVPVEECILLAQWAVDSYYKIVIAGRQGIPALVRAMKSFPMHQGLQECCCLALGNLCSGETNLLAVESAGGLHMIIFAMKNHPRSVAVQSAACDALRNMSALFLTASSYGGDVAQQSLSPSPPLSASSSQQLQPQLVEVLSHAKSMILHPTHLRIADSLLQSLMC